MASEAHLLRTTPQQRWRREVKAHEDALDAVICAWVGVCALEDRATPFGDENSAIWIPSAQGRASSVAILDLHPDD
jgi:predicted RNase H-like nuclease